MGYGRDIEVRTRDYRGEEAVSGKDKTTQNARLPNYMSSERWDLVSSRTNRYTIQQCYTDWVIEGKYEQGKSRNKPVGGTDKTEQNAWLPKRLLSETLFS